jgi:hypothetical protein
MPKMTQSNALVAALVKRGLVEQAGTSRKYRTFGGGKDPNRLYFVGKSGALRVGRNATDSTSLERTSLRKMLLREGGYQC